MKGRVFALGLAALAILGGAAVTFATLDRYGFWSDEVHTVDSSRRDFGSMVTVRLARGHPPLFHSIEWIVSRTVGESETAFRFPAALAGLAAVCVLAAWLFWAGHPWIAAATAAFLLSSEIQLYLSQIARPYAQVELLSLISTWVLLLDRNRDRPRHAVAFGLLCLLNLYTHFPAGFVVAAQVLYLLTRRPVPRRMLRAAAAAALAFAPIAFWFANLTDVDDRISWIERGTRPFWSVFAEPYLSWKSAWAVPVAIVTLLLGALGIRRLGPSGTALGFLWLGPPTLAGLLSLFGFPETYRISRYFAASHAAQAALVVGSLAGPWSRRTVPAALLVAALTALSARETLHYLDEGKYPAWREAAALVAARRGDDEVAVLHRGWRTSGWNPFLYYYPEPFYDLREPNSPPRTRARRYPLPHEEGDPAQLALPPETRGVWIVSPGFDQEREVEAQTLADLVERFPEEETIWLRRVQVVHRWKTPEASR